MIAYVQSDGKISGSCYGDSPESLNGITKIPDGCTAIYIDDTQYPDVWMNQGEYTIQDGVPTYTPIPDSVKLQNAIQAKVNELTEAHNSANPTFQSSALGTIHTYISDETAMNKFNAKYAFVNGASYDGKDILWYTLEEGGVEHTKDQFNQVWLDGQNIFTDDFAKWDNLDKQAKAITIDNQTLDEAITQINAIVWE